MAVLADPGSPISPSGTSESRPMSQLQAPLDDKVHSALQANPYFSGRSLRFETESGRVTLRGVVRSYFQKQMAQEALRHVEGIHEIHNELEVAGR